MTEPYELYYWPMLPGRGELVRLVLEQANAPYVDVARLSEEEGGGIERLMAFIRGERSGQPPYAPPFLVHGDLVLAQTAAICAYLGERHALAPADPNQRFQTLQLQLTIADVVDEAHNTHHPVSALLYYEDQKDAAAEAAKQFLDQRLPRFLSYFERVLERNGGQWLIGEALSYADLSLFQLLEGLDYAFPQGLVKVTQSTPLLLALRSRVAGLPRIAAYLASSRRLPFNEYGIFRHYPELDLER
jgi:glutathione S-transferase